MTSDSGGGSVDRFAALLGRAGGGARPNSVELAELLWLAGKMSPGDPVPEEARPATLATPDAPAPPQPASAQPDPQPAPTPPPAPAPRLPASRVPLRLPGGRDADDPAGSFTTLLAPAPPMLSHPLALQRTLRPLKRRVPAPVGQELDEEATAHRIAGLGAAPQWWLPVLRPVSERWLTLHLVHDTGPTMPVWRPLVRELHTTLVQSGVFRTVELHRLDADGTVRRPGSQESYAAGRTVTLLVSDCMGPQWRGGAAGARWYRTLRRWAARMPVAVVQPLPERLWRTTALPAEPAQLGAPWPAAPNATYTVDCYLAESLPSGVLPLPVLEPAAPWLGNWSSLVAGAGRLPGSVGLLGPTPPPAPVDERGRGDVERLSPEELVLRFRSLASPEAFRLAGHLAVGQPQLPVMRLVQAAIERRPQPQHLAEVILSGLLTHTGAGPDAYAFRPGVRPLLLRTLPRSAHGRTSELLARVGALIDARAGVAAGDFPVLAPGGDSPASAGEPFAAVREESVRRLGGHGGGPEGLLLGRYRLLRRLGRGSPQVWEAKDTRLDRMVAAYEYSAARNHQQFVERARQLAEIDHRNIVTVHDFGIDRGVPYLVTEFVEGVTLAELTAQGGFRLPFTMLAPLARQVARGLKAVHQSGTAHGRFTPNSLQLDPDGGVKITRFAMMPTDADDISKDLNDFGWMLIKLSGVNEPNPSPHVPLERGPLFTAVSHSLGSADPDVQRQGLDLLLSPSFEEILDAAAADRLRYRLLGPVRVSRGDQALPSLPPEERALLAMLLLRHGRTVSYDDLIAGLRERQPPDDRPAQALAAHASALRRALGPGALATTTDGYALLAPPSTIDINRCEDLVATAKSRRDEGDPAAAREAIKYALALWHGEPLDGAPGPAAKATRTRLHALYLSLCATRAELDLELGHFEQAAGDLTALLQEHSKREDFRRLHILALKGMGRITDAMASYEAYETHREQQHSEPNPTMLALYRELRAAPERGRSTVVAEFTEPGDHPAAYDVLGRTLTRLLSLSDLASNAYEVLARDNGYVVITEPDTSVLPILDEVFRELSHLLTKLEQTPRVRLTFWHTAHFARPGVPTRQPDLEAALANSTADLVVVLSPALHEELTASGVDLVGGHSFRPVHRGSAAGPAIAWYCSLNITATVADPGQHDLAQGPFTTRDLQAIPAPEPGRTAVVRSRSDGRLTLLTPDRPLGTRPAYTPVTYYEVDLTTHRASHRLSLPSAGGGSFAASVELSWYVDDPVSFVAGETSDVSGRLLDHLVKTAGRLTRRHPLRRAGAAQLAVRDGLQKWPVPGLSVACSVVLTAEEEPAPAAPEPPPSRPSRRAPSRAEAAPPDAPAALDAAEAVLLGFDGPVARLYTRQASEQAIQDLVALFVELRHPDEALGGERLLSQSTLRSRRDEAPDPLDLLRALAHHRLGADLRQALHRVEERAARSARPTPHAASLIRALGTLGPPAAVVSDISTGALLTYLESRDLMASVPGGAHGRADDLTLLTPDPFCLLRALSRLGTAPADALLITSSVTEVTAARSIGLPVLGYAPGQQARLRLVEAGCELTVASLEPVLEAVRAD
ncbi:SAV_2336 N-terminal domain-related protein [Streptomyces sp. NPDC005485]|uniref:SAV_2336 N-terminal domain-related protein n=1 Tax=Streptomyces sp. NPDC005485 TaxID=3155591 RepID=UPI0033A0A368